MSVVGAVDNLRVERTINTRPETDGLQRAFRTVQGKYDEGTIRIHNTYNKVQINSLSVHDKNNITKVHLSEKVQAVVNSRYFRGFTAFIVTAVALSVILGTCLAVTLNPWAWVAIGIAVLGYAIINAIAAGLTGGSGCNTPYHKRKLEREMELSYLFARVNPTYAEIVSPFENPDPAEPLDINPPGARWSPEIERSRMDGEGLDGLIEEEEEMQIPIYDPQGYEEGQIFLGSILNRNSSDTPGQIADKLGLTTVISINDLQERKPGMLVHPMTSEHYEELGLGYVEIDWEDHKPVDPVRLEAGADAIHAVVSNGGNIYIHCKAGQGRSAMLIAAYLIKYKGMTAKAAAKYIKQYRPKATVDDSRTAIIGANGSGSPEAGYYGKKYKPLGEFEKMLIGRNNSVTHLDGSASFVILKDPSVIPPQLKPHEPKYPRELPEDVAADPELCKAYFRKYNSDERILTPISYDPENNREYWKQFRDAMIQTDIEFAKLKRSPDI